MVIKFLVEFFPEYFHLLLCIMGKNYVRFLGDLLDLGLSVKQNCTGPRWSLTTVVVLSTTLLLYSQG